MGNGVQVRSFGVRRSPSSPRYWFVRNWLALAAVLLVAIVLAMVAADRVLGAPRRDLELLGWFLTASGALSLLLGGGLIRWAGPRVGSVRRRLALAYGAGLIVALANVVTTSALMFLNAHDLGLLLLLLAFSGVVSLAFAYVMAGPLTAQIQQLSSTAARLAEGDMSARVGGVYGSDEIGHLVNAFDDMAEQLQRAFERQRALEASRRELITAVSHDLRTPLATTRAMVEAMADGVVSEPADVHRYLKLILQETQFLSRLIDDLFELSQIDSGALRLECMPIDFGELVAETVAAYELASEEAGVRLEQHVAPARIDADPERLQRVLRNLLDNALRHTPAGGVICVSSSSVERTVELCIADSGHGVAREDLERIFDRFYRSEPSRQRTGVGTGLGLAIARGIVQAHHGRIWAEPSPAGGLKVQMRLPLAS
jgi:two-component system sensor histidine kinase BaeS